MKTSSDEKRTAKEILNFINMVCFSEEWMEWRFRNGSNGIRDIIIEHIRNKYGVN